MKIYHTCVSFFPYRMSFCLLLLKPHKLCHLTAALTLGPTGRAVGEGAAPIHLLCSHVFAGQTEYSCSTLEDCKASSVLVLKSQLKLHKGFNSISHLQSAIEKCKTALHYVFLNELFPKFREEVGDNHVNSHLSIPTQVPYI